TRSSRGRAAALLRQGRVDARRACPRERRAPRSILGAGTRRDGWLHEFGAAALELVGIRAARPVVVQYVAARIVPPAPAGDPAGPPGGRPVCSASPSEWSPSRADCSTRPNGAAPSRPVSPASPRDSSARPLLEVRSARRVERRTELATSRGINGARSGSNLRAGRSVHEHPSGTRPDPPPASRSALADASALWPPS